MDSTASQLDVTRLEFKPPTKNPKGMKSVLVTTVPGSSDPQHRIRFQMSGQNDLQTIIWGLSAPPNGVEPGTNVRYTLDLTVDSPELAKKLKEIDEKLVEGGVANATEWFGAAKDRAAVENAYVPLFRPPYKDGVSPSVRTKVSTGERATTVWVVKSESEGSLQYYKGSEADLTKGSKCMAMVESSNLWFINKQFGMSLNVTDIIVWPNKRASGIHAFKLPGVQLKEVTAMGPEAECPDDDHMFD